MTPRQKAKLDKQEEDDGLAKILHKIFLMVASCRAEPTERSANNG